MFKNPPIPVMNANGTLCRGNNVQVSPLAAEYPNGCSSMAANTMQSITATNVKNALKVARKLRVSNVRGRDAKKQMNAVMAENTIVQAPWLVIVLRYLAPTKTCTEVVSISKIKC